MCAATVTAYIVDDLRRATVLKSYAARRYVREIKKYRPH